MIYVYAVAELSLAPLPPVRRIADQPLEWLACAGMGVACTRHPAGTRIPPSAENVWRHEQVVEAVMGRETPLPARFATTFPDEQSVHDILDRHADRIAAGLARVR